VEDRVVGRVDLIATVTIAGDKEGGDALAHEVGLVRRGVRTKDGFGVLVETIRDSTRRVIDGDAEIVEVLLGGDERAEVIVGLEERACVLALVGIVEMIKDDVLDNADRVGVLAVKVATNLLGEGSGNVGRERLADDGGLGLRCSREGTSKCRASAAGDAHEREHSSA
jgi:hypothetical protein